MTRDWTFTFPIANQWYNIWDLITQDPSFVDRTFSNAPYVPNIVQEFKFQNVTAGATFSRSDSKKESTGFQLTGGSWDVDRSMFNTINLNNQYFMTDTAGSQLYVKITAN